MVRDGTVVAQSGEQHERQRGEAKQIIGFPWRS